MDKFVINHISTDSVKRLFISLGIVTGISSFLIYNGSYYYWNQTIFRTQTVDFNILSNIMPTKLSIHLINNESKSLQKTIDSNYGFFGIVITDCKREGVECPEQKVLYLSKGEIKEEENGKRSYIFSGFKKQWQSLFSEVQLEENLYMILRDPPPLDAEWEFEYSKLVRRNHNNTGKVIGRAYLIRNPSPGFKADMKSWLSSPLKTSGANPIYNGILGAALFTALLAWLIFEILFYKKEIAEAKTKEAEQKTLIETSKRLEAENIALTSKTKLQEEAQKRLQAENEWLRLKSLWEGFHESLDRDYTSVIANQLEELSGFFRRLNTNIINIVHDLHKAPLLTIHKDITEDIIKQFKDNPSLITKLDEEKRETLVNNITEFFRDTDKTIKSIQWVIDDLSQVANLNSNNIDLQSTIIGFLKNQPPGVQSSGIHVNFDDQASQPIYIFANEWHLKSIIKNVLYNCRAALMKYELELDDDDIDFEGIIDIICSNDEDNAYITILDNGAGYPKEILNKLYQCSEKINTDSKRGMGNIIIYSYLTLHSGEAHIENRPEGGGKAIFSFPLVREQENTPQEVI